MAESRVIFHKCSGELPKWTGNDRERVWIFLNKLIQCVFEGNFCFSELVGCVHICIDVIIFFDHIPISVSDDIVGKNLKILNEVTTIQGGTDPKNRCFVRALVDEIVIGCETIVQNKGSWVFI